MRYRLPTALLAVLWLWSATTSPVSCYAEDVICDPAVNTTDYFCRGWQDGVGQYGSRVRFIARMIGEDYGDDFGSQIVPLGDINGDGRGDFAVFVKNKCEWRIFLGDTLISRTPFMIWPRGDAPYPCSPFPGNLDVIPDVIGNGQLTLVRGFAGYPRSIWFYSLGTTFDTIPEFKLTDTAFASPGTFAGGFDINGDGQPDLVVGDPDFLQQSPKKEHGRAYLYWGGTALDSIPDLIFSDTFWVGQNQPYPVGGAVAVLPSLNADSYPDLVVGRASNSVVLDPPGQVDVFFGGPAMDTVRDLVLFSPDTAFDQGCNRYPADIFGWIVRDVGDVNQDGFEDLLVTEDCGDAFVYYGGPSFDTEFDLRTQGGSQAMGFGDINGDGYSDYGTAVPGNELTPGWVYVRFARPDPTGAVDWTIVGDDWFYTGPSFGRETTWLGDIDGDGFADFAVGMKTTIDEQNEGGIYVFAGYDPDIYSGVFDEPEIPLPSDMRLVEHIAPNPFNTGTTIRLSQAFTSGQVVIYDILGRPVRRFAIDRSHQSGEIVWDSCNDTGRPVSSGLYFARVTSGRQSETHKLMLLK